MFHLIHNYVEICDVEHFACGKCFHEPESYWTDWEKANADKYPRGYCPHGVKVCKCGKWKSYGSHGEMSLLWAGCYKQVQSMAPGIRIRKYRDYDIYIDEEEK